MDAQSASCKERPGVLPSSHSRLPCTLAHLRVMHDGRAVPQVVTYGWTHRAHARERAWNDQACFPRPIPGCPVHLRVMHDGRAVPQVVTYGWTHRAHARERA